jgi:hypothetical protein
VTPTIELSRSPIRALAALLRALIEANPARSIRGLARQHAGLPDHAVRKILRLPSPGTVRLARRTLDRLAHVIDPMLTRDDLLRKLAVHLPARAPVVPIHHKRAMIRRAAVRR